MRKYPTGRTSVGCMIVARVVALYFLSDVASSEVMYMVQSENWGRLFIRVIKTRNLNINVKMTRRQPFSMLNKNLVGIYEKKRDNTA